MAADPGVAPTYFLVQSPDVEPDAAVCVAVGASARPGQVERVDGVVARVWWLAGDADDRAAAALLSTPECPAGEWAWERAESHASVLRRDGRAVLRYEHPVFDPDRIEETKKPFHHVFDPDGRRPITKGVGGQFSHHRGIFYGYNDIRIEGEVERLDVWHGADGEHTEHVRVLEEYAGPVMGGHRVEILWKDRGGTPFIEEERDVRVFDLPGDELLIDVVSTLRSLRGAIALGGDRQHAGVQFRAAQEVADSPESTRFIRPAAWAHLPADQEQDGAHFIDLPWNAMRFSLDGRSYTVAYLSHPSNPEGADMSERQYGRIGEFIRRTISPTEPSTLRYRFWISADRPIGREDIARRHAEFAGSAHPAGGR
ncbi:MAG TPA: DUF6807 family protein [Longimicrobiales bacterium]|nr:DUF6807 family protein [Longimicrobiales bacterium]